MKNKALYILLALAAIYLVLKYYPAVRERIEKNCNDRGGSYLAGHCIILPR